MAEVGTVRKAPRWRLAYTFAIALALLVALPTVVCAGGGPRNVLLVANQLSEVSLRIASYYEQARGLPQKNVFLISCPTDEFVSREVCESQIREPISRRLQEPDMAEIDYIVITKGIPVAADYGNTSGPYSVSSILTCVALPNSSIPLINPYGPIASSDGSPAPEIAWSSKHLFRGRKFYNVTRLDAFAEQDVMRMIDGAVRPARSGKFLLDKRTGYSGAYLKADERLGTGPESAYSVLVSANQIVECDNTTEFISGRTDLIGYFSWGNNDCGYSYEKFIGNQFVAGSIADTYCSTSARTFIKPASSNCRTLIADLFPQGVCGAVGYVSEPFIYGATYPNILFDRYIKGYNMAESFFAACPQLFWKSVIIGDPLMAPFATPPSVRILGLNTPISGTAAKLRAQASDASGIDKVDFYIDDVLVGTARTAPYEVSVDTTQFAVGIHFAEAIAYEDSPVHTQSRSRGVVEIVDCISELECCSEAMDYPDGKLVTLTGKIVTAATGTVRPGFYVVDSDRSCGIYIMSDALAQEGSIVDVIGTVTTVDGERAILPVTTPIVRTAASPPLRPLAIRVADIGGCAVGESTPTIGNCKVTRNVGLLVRTWGRVITSGDSWFYIDDGSRVRDCRGNCGVKVLARGKWPVGSFVAVTGISSSETVSEESGVFVPVIRARYSSDVTFVEDSSEGSTIGD